MSKIGLIIKREYLRRVSKKSFILLTFLTPFLFAALVFVPLWLSSIKGDEVHTIAILDSTGKYAPLFEDTETYRFIHSDQSMDTYKQIPDKEIFAFLTIAEDLLENPKAATLYSKKQIPGELSRLVNMTLKRQIESDKLATFNIPNLKEIIKEIIEFDLDEGRMDYLDDMIDVFSKDGCEMVDILFDRFLKKYYADIDVSNERMTINLTDEEGHVLSFNLSQSEVHYVLHMVERRLNSFMRDDGGGGFSDED